MLYVLGVLAFALALVISIGLHELGHMIPAKKFGGKVTQYFVGFGPTVWSTQRGETEYGIKAIPLGGYVKIVGMLPPGGDDLADEVTTDADGNTVTKVRKSNTGMFAQLISDARAAEWETITAADSDRLFYKMPWWKKVIVMAGGPTVNLVIAFVLFLLIFGLYGVRSQEVDAGRPVVDEVSTCLLPYAESGRACTTSDNKTPAYLAGLKPGDTITAFGGQEITSWSQLRRLIRSNGDEKTALTYERDGQSITKQITTTVQARPTSANDETLTQVGFLGISPATHTVVTHGGPLFTLEQMGYMTKDSVVALAQLPVKVWGVGKAIVGVEPRAADSPISIVGGGRIAGEVSSQSDFPVAEKLAFLASLAAGFNLFIGLFNFVPLLPLDGGHIASALWEALRRGFARLFGRPDPGHVDAAKLLPVAYVVASALLVMGVVLIVGDLVVPVQMPAG
ncbi:site-2 protease family protein [Nocardioides sp. CBS4Y-1]|uniref:Site-2 protease family protein n=1 Tax=Nocardioides acrostichi TaxID=2784339 RepID=A0A930UUM5_9ACTN|nr:site-2 protease family protein [Nocardioides acrostichi]